MYNFKRDAKVYLYVEGTLYPLEVYSDLEFSQTFNEQSFNRKTLHNQLALYPGASITEANVASFSFTAPIKYDSDIQPMLELFEADYATGTIEPIDIYISFTDIIYKLDQSVIEGITYNIDQTSVFTMTVSGSFSKLEPVTALPTTPEDQNTDPYTIIRGVEVTLNSVVLPSIAAINLEVNNSIEWTKNNTLHTSLAGQTAYRNSYVLTERRVSGSVTEFLQDTSGPDYSTTSSMEIKLYSSIGESPPFLTFVLPEVVYTRRFNMNEILTQVYDFRLTSNELLIIPELTRGV